jgi:hypothetical protein
LKIIEKEFKRYVGKKWDLNANKDMKKAHYATHPLIGLNEKECLMFEENHVPCSSS